jgi:tripartite-type tricarboxylate transporter receptor subunit TctC
MNKYLAVALAGTTILTISPARAQSYPDRPIKLVVPYPPGGPADTVARVTTQGLAAQLGGTVIIENMPGAGGKLGTKNVARAPADGYTLLLGSSNEYAVTPALYKNLDFDPVKELIPVAALVTDSVAIVVNPSLPVHSLAELVRYTNEHPGKLTSGSTLGIAPHLALMYFEARTHANILFVPYKGAAPALADAMGNQIQVTCSAKSVLLPLIKADKLRALAVSSAKRWPELPEVPTFHESGLDGFPPVVLFALLAPAGTPPDIIDKLNAAEAARINSSGTQTGIAKLGMDPAPLSLKALTKALADEVPMWKAVVAEAGVHLD